MEEMKLNTTNKTADFEERRGEDEQRRKDSRERKS